MHSTSTAMHIQRAKPKGIPYLTILWDSDGTSMKRDRNEE
jgi:hypothetical protein